MRVLLNGYYVSRWDVIFNLLEELFHNDLPTEEAKIEWADLLLGLRYINAILDKYEVNGDFLSREDYQPLQNELVGMISEIIKRLAMSFNRLQTMRDNIEAIRLAFRLGVAGCGAQTAEEIAVLRKYAGFGGLKCILNDANDWRMLPSGANPTSSCLRRPWNCVASSMIILRMIRNLRGIWIL